MNLKKYKSIAELFAIHAVHIYVSQNAIGTLRMDLFVCFEPPEQFFSYPAAVTITGDCQGCKFRPMLGPQGLWAGRDLYRATPTVTWDLGLYGLIRKTGTQVPQWGLNPQVKDHQILEPDALTTEPRRLLSLRMSRALDINVIWQQP